MPLPRDIRTARFVSVRKAAKMLDRSAPTVRGMCEEGKLTWEAIDDGQHGLYAILKSSIHEHLAARRRGEV